MHLVKTGRPLGERLNVLMDNTGSDNKCAEMILFLGYLVLNDHFREASFFCMIKGHTFSLLDQMFNVMINFLLAIPIYTMSTLMAAMFESCKPYGCRDRVELPYLWDWGRAFGESNVTRMAGFCTGQFGAGMHECLVRKDNQGVVRVWMRKSSKASNWLPEGPGFQLFLDNKVEGFPPQPAKMKADISWFRRDVETTIRAWSVTPPPPPSTPPSPSSRATGTVL